MTKFYYPEAHKNRRMCGNIANHLNLQSHEFWGCSIQADGGGLTNKYKYALEEGSRGIGGHHS